MRRSKRIYNPIFVEDEPYNWGSPTRSGPKFGYILSMFVCVVISLYMFAP